MAIQSFPQSLFVHPKKGNADSVPQKKTQKMASNKHVFISSACNKISEFQQLGYPKSILSGACTFLAATTGNGAWMSVKRYIQ